MPNDFNRRDFLASASSAAIGIAAALSTASAAEPPARPAKKKTVLVIGAHLDDCEIGAGGLIFKALRGGHRVVLLNVASDYSTWCGLKGREKEVREEVKAKAKEIGVEKRFLGFGYQQVIDDLVTARKISEVVADVHPDIVVMPDRHPENNPSDHGIVGQIAERAARNYQTILGGVSGWYHYEAYAYEIYPNRDFRPDVYFDISDVLKPVLETIGYFDRMYGEAPTLPQAGVVKSTFKLQPDGEEWQLRTHDEMKLATARFRGAQCHLRFAEAYRAIDPMPLGKRVLEEIVDDGQHGKHPAPRA